MSVYDPTTEDIRHTYSCMFTDIDKFRGVFDRWLEAHDRGVAAKTNTDLARKITSAIATRGGTDTNIVNRILEILDETL